MMMKVICTVVLSALLCAEGQAQLDKGSCEEIFRELHYQEYEIIVIYPNTSETPFSFYAATREMVFREEYILIKNGDGINFYVPYDKIQLIRDKTTDKKPHIVLVL